MSKVKSNIRNIFYFIILYHIIFCFSNKNENFISKTNQINKYNTINHLIHNYNENNILLNNNKNILYYSLFNIYSSNSNQILLRKLEEQKIIITIKSLFDRKVEQAYIEEDFYNNNRPQTILKNDGTGSAPSSNYIELNEYEVAKLEIIWDHKLTNLINMFSNIDILLSVDFTSFDTSQVKNMNSMFKYCSNLISLDLSNFDTSLVTTMESMFYSCTSLTSLDISNFNTTSVTNINNMFGGTYNLNFINLLNYIGSSDILTNIGSKNVCIREMPAGSFSAINIYGAIDISININFCVYLKSINVGIYSDNKITKLKEVDYCNWKINLGNQKRESLFEFKFILYVLF